MEPDEIKNQVLIFMRDNGLTQQELAQKTGIHQSQISRIINAKFKTASKNVKALCKYANINLDQPSNRINVRPEKNKELMEAITYVWDGTSVRAKALARVIRSLKGL